MNVAVTSLIATCNRSSFVRQALKSAQGQIGVSQTVIVSDCSDDPLEAAKIREIASEFDGLAKVNVRYVRQERRMSHAEHRARALKLIETPYAAMLDDDDCWLPPHLQRSVDWLQMDPSHGLAVSNRIPMEASGDSAGVGEVPSRKLPADSDPSGWLRLFTSGSFSSTSGFVFRTSAVEELPVIDNPCPDILAALWILLKGYQCKGWEQASFLYRVHHQSHYRAGDHLRDRHRLRVSLMHRAPLTVLWNHPLFAVYYMKSFLWLARQELSRKIVQLVGCAF